MLTMSENDTSWIEELRVAEQLPKSYTQAVLKTIAPLAERICTLRRSLARPVVIGINGAQGSGKSTLVKFLAGCIQRGPGPAAVSLSLDDLYLGKQARRRLADEQHPLLRTRGVPGTHDVALGIATLDALTAQGANTAVRLPGFDKARDDRVASAELRWVTAPVDIVLFEGWCVGVRPQRDTDLSNPVNALEAEEDADGSWRSFVNNQLKNDYAELFSRLDALVMLRIPSFEKVYEWRELQERRLPNGAGMSTAELQRFIMHYERLTRHMLARMPDYAHTIVELDASHELVKAVNKDWPQARRPRDAGP